MQHHLNLIVASSSIANYIVIDMRFFFKIIRKYNNTYKKIKGKQTTNYAAIFFAVESNRSNLSIRSCNNWMYANKNSAVYQKQQQCTFIKFSKKRNLVINLLSSNSL